MKKKKDEKSPMMCYETYIAFQIQVSFEIGSGAFRWVRE